MTIWTIWTIWTVWMAGAGVLVLAVAGTFLLPREVGVERQAAISAEPHEVLRLAASNEGYQRFNPYLTLDRGLKIAPFGPSSGTGSGFRFDGKRQLARAHERDDLGRYQLEAAIEDVHITRKNTGRTDWAALNKLYIALLKMAPSAGALVGQAAVTGRLHGPEAGSTALQAAEDQIGSGFQPLWAARADMNARLGRHAVAAECYWKAISLATDQPTIRFLTNRLAGAKADA